MFEQYKKLLAEFVSFKSISTDPKYRDGIAKTVLWLKKQFLKNKFKVEVIKTKEANPVVFASYQTDDLLPTVLIYGHYDVQPAEKSDGWTNDPFSLSEKKGRLLARGVVDNKGQIVTHMFAAFNLIKKKKLKYNVKFLIEGNEETGNVALSKVMAKNKKKMKCDFVLVSDGELTNNNPTIDVSLRGGFNCMLTYITAKNNVHSGIFGGAIPSASYELSKFLSNLYDKNNSVSFSEFYDDLEKPTKKELENNKKLFEQSEDIKNLAGVKTLLTERGVDFFTQTGLRPTIQISGIKAGYGDEGFSNIVPANALAKLNFRLAPGQSANKMVKVFEKYVKANTPKYVDYKLYFEGLHDPVKVNIDNEYVVKIKKLLKNIYGSEPRFRNVGGAIPFVGDVKEILGVDTIMVPLVNEDCNMHGANENYDTNLAKKGIEFSLALLSSD